ncbi:MAG: hypothetical protein HQL59_13115, partial [Magnetococcales bacterium]|nr:hypothetical protein [Magnetococcales bacterium]
MTDEAMIGRARQTRVVLMAASLLALVLGLALAVLLERSVTWPLRTCFANITRLSQGDLSLKCSLGRRDEMGRLFEMLSSLAERLRRTIGDIRTATDRVGSGSVELTETAQGMSTGASRQAASIEETSSSMEEMADSIRKNTENAQQTEKIARQASRDAEEGGRAVVEAVAAMKEIAGRISVIEEIARQTNLLALNAAI